MLKTPLLYTLLALGASAVAALPSPTSYQNFVPAMGREIPKMESLGSEGFDQARELLAAGKLDQARAAAEKELSRDPYNTEGYLLMFDIAQAQPEPDIEAMLRWGKWMIWSYGASGSKTELAYITDKMDALYPEWNADTAALLAWRKEVEKAIKSASSKKQYRLAGHLINKLLDWNPNDKKLLKTYDKLADKAGNELSGGAFVSDKVRRKSAKWLAKNNAKHSDWDSRWEMKTKHYEIETTMDYEFFMTLSAAMDEMNAFYRNIYGFKKKIPRARLAVHQKRSDFDRFSQELTGRPMQSESIGGFWTNNTRTVVAYDRSMGDPNQTRADLWNTLFHEASHQFMSSIMKKGTRKGYVTPSWLEEGAASYFEGCVIKADGTILKNNVAEHRLRSWWGLEQSGRGHTLEELIANIRNTGPDETGLLSYEGTYYPYGWAFVYFLLNYEENDRRVYAPAITPGEAIPSEYKAVTKAGRLVYRDAYNKYIDFFAEEGNKKNDQQFPFEVAKRIFVDEIEEADVPNWEAFENRWRRFTNSLYGEMMAGPEFADVLHSRCRGYLLAEDYERARTTAEQADLKRPNDMETFRLLAMANEGEGLKGDAMFWMVRHWEAAWPAGDEVAAAEAETWIAEHGGKTIVASYIEPTKATLIAIRGKMNTAMEDGHPIMGTLFASHAMQAFQLQFPDLITESKEMADQAGQDLRVWQAAYARGPEANRTAKDDAGVQEEVVVYADDGVLIHDPAGWAGPGFEFSAVGNLQLLAPPYSIRGTVQLDGVGAAIPLGIDRSGKAQCYIMFENYPDDEDALLLKTSSFSVDSRKGSASLQLVQVGGFRWERTDTIHFLLEVAEDGTGKITVNGEYSMELPKEFRKSMLTGRFAITAYEDSYVLYSNFEVRPSTAFWPVAVSGDE